MTIPGVNLEWCPCVVVEESGDVVKSVSFQTDANQFKVLVKSLPLAGHGLIGMVSVPLFNKVNE